MSNSFSKPVIFDKKPLLTVIVPQLRNDGVYYEVNIKGYPRFFMTWSPLGRFDVVNNEGVNIPYQLILAVSDMIEKNKK